MERVKSYVLLVIFLILVWLLLTWPVTVQELAAGIVFAAIISAISGRTLRLLMSIRLSPRAIGAAIAFFFVFLSELIKANLDVAFRVLQPSLPINPGIVRVKTTLTNPLARILLANSITLTPGTITVETNGDEYYVHWIAVPKGSDVNVATAKIVSTFEKYLEVFLG